MFSCQNTSNKQATDDKATSVEEGAGEAVDPSKSATEEVEQVPAATEGDATVETTPIEANEPITNGSLTLTPVTNSPIYDNAAIAITSPADGAKQNNTNVAFQFDVKNYALGNQTADAEQKMCANSAKGQHIHLILNNEPYSAHYQAQFGKELSPNNYLALAFLSRSYHESLKTADAYSLSQFMVGTPKTQTTYDLKAPHLFYSRPKGEYVGEANVQKILLDFYLVNTEISPEGNKVKATINGTEFLLDKWQPYFVEGLPMGENTFKLELVDKDGQLIEGPFNTVERKIKLHKEEPLDAE